MAEMKIHEALQKAVTAYNAGETEAAKRLFARIIAIEPSQPDANSNMGVILVAGGDLEEALPFIKAALEANFSVAQYWFNYIDVLFKLNRFSESAELLAIARTKGCNGKVFDDLGDKLSSTEVELRSRIERLGKLDLDGPGAYHVFFGIGEAWQRLGKQEEAIEAYNKALALKPNYAAAYYNMGIALQEQGKLEASIEAYNKALAIKPDYADAYNNMGNALKDQGKLEKAIEAYNKALSLKPDYAEAYINMGNALQDQGKFEKAIEAYNKALSIKPDYAEAASNLGACLLKSDRYEEGRSLIRKGDGAISL